MAKIERQINGNIYRIIDKVENGILNGSASASLEESSFFSSGEAKCAVRVFERYSYMGGNRVSLNVTFFQGSNNSPVFISGITSGGSQAVFFKMNTFGEEAFLQKLSEVIDNI